MISGPAALHRLQEGNRRFVANLHEPAVALDETRRAALALGQQPFAIVLGCSDSRVPAEIVFGQGFGDLFVIRVAGNIVAPSQIGSVEFAASLYGTRLAVVLGHTQCGAVLATLQELGQGTRQPSPNLRAIVDRIRPAVEPLVSTARALEPSELVSQAVRANIRASVGQLRHGSRILEDLVARQGLLIVGAEYHLETGAVEFLDPVPT